jgi:hypothetical protein
VITKEGLMGVQSREEVKTLITHHFGIQKHELYVYRSQPKPFIVIFSEGRARDLVFAAGRLIDGPIELAFHSWILIALAVATSPPTMSDCVWRGSHNMLGAKRWQKKFSVMKP